MTQVHPEKAADYLQKGCLHTGLLLKEQAPKRLMLKRMKLH
jgi:hypothetical protein